LFSDEISTCWSGRGPAPAWLASAKDRARFSIEGGGTSVVGSGEKHKAESNKAGVVNKGVVAPKSRLAQIVPARKAAVRESAKSTPKNSSGKKLGTRKAIVKKAATPNCASPATFDVTLVGAVDAVAAE
jgi:hypothetical protein